MHIITISLILAVICGAFYCLTYYQKPAQAQTAQRNIEISRNAIDYDAYFEQFDSVNFRSNEKLSTLTFVQTVDEEFLSEINNASSTTHYAGEVCYDIEYDNETDKVYLNATLYLDDDGNCLFEKVEGVACWNENINNIDIVFEAEDGVVFLSDLDENINNCGWFKKALKFVKKHAVAIVATVAVVAVVATVAVAAPALVAAATATVSVGGGTAGISAGLVAAGSAIASSTLVSTTIAAAAVTTGVVAAAIMVEPIADGIEQVVDKTTGKILEIIYKGVSYASAVLTATVASTLAKDAYFMTLANPKTGEMIYTTTAISKDFAVSIMAANTSVSVYTYYEKNARSIAQQAENDKSPILERATEMGYFDHYHTYSHTKPHAFFGLPKVA